MDRKLLDIICCPVTRSSLELLPERELAALNELIAQKRIKNREDSVVDAPLDELVRRVRERGGPDAEALIADVLIGLSDRFERPDPDEIALYDRYVGPEDDPLAA